MSSSKIISFFARSSFKLRPRLPVSEYFRKRRFFSVFEKNPRPLEYDRYLVWRAFSKTSIFVVENAVYVWAGGANLEKNLRFRKYPVTCGRGLRCETASGIVLCYSRQACCLLSCLCHINNGSHTYQFTFEILLLCFRMWLWFQIGTKIFADRRFLVKKRHGFAYPINSPLQWISLYDHLSV